MDGVPGLSFHGIRPGETLRVSLRGEAVGHLLVSQPLRISGAGWPLRSARHRAARARAVQIRPRTRRHADGLDGRRSEARVREAEEAARTTTTSGSARPATSSRTCGSRGSRRRVAERKMWGHMRMKRHRSRRRDGLHLHLSDERRGPGRQLDGTVHAGRARAAALHQRLGDVVFRRADSGAEDDGRGRGRPARASGVGRRVPHRRGGNLRRDRRALRPGRLHDLRAVERTAPATRGHACGRARRNAGTGASPLLDGGRRWPTAAEMGAT